MTVKNKITFWCFTNLCCKYQLIKDTKRAHFPLPPLNAFSKFIRSWKISNIWQSCCQGNIYFSIKIMPSIKKNIVPSDPLAETISLKQKIQQYSPGFLSDAFVLSLCFYLLFFFTPSNQSWIPSLKCHKKR